MKEIGEHAMKPGTGTENGGISSHMVAEHIHMLSMWK